ncbi:hypothetical protein PENTCL1PPCAC_9069, partial [Pristionchus entomophagus]
CVPMTQDQTVEIFNEIRFGKPPSILSSNTTTLDLVTKLTKLERDHRAKFDEILAHPFFSE